MIDSSLYRLKGEITELKRHRRHGRLKPHKLLLLLAVLDLAQDGLLHSNQIYFDGALETRFVKHFDLHQQGDDLCQFSEPFFHLRSSPFWHHKIRLEKETAYAKLDTSGGGLKRILDTIEYAFLSEYAFEVIRQETTRREIRVFIETMLRE